MDTFLEALAAPGESADRGGKMDLYAWLIGSWDLDVREYGENGEVRRRPGEWHFGWVLEGRAIQDVWIVPPRGARSGDAAKNAEYYGTTLRVFDPQLSAWRIRWSDPVSGIHLAQIGRKDGDGILQEGKLEDGRLIRWSFRDITANWFLWRSEISPDGGGTWHLNLDFIARRKG
jgi:hypothetical protein